MIVSLSLCCDSVNLCRELRFLIGAPSGGRYAMPVGCKVCPRWSGEDTREMAMFIHWLAQENPVNWLIRAVRTGVSCEAMLVGHKVRPRGSGADTHVMAMCIHWLAQENSVNWLTHAVHMGVSCEEAPGAARAGTARVREGEVCYTCRPPDSTLLLTSNQGLQNRHNFENRCKIQNVEKLESER
jgi:hypothetical protein